jgi:crotonobetainyl-CoA:carnitine CoA-transferase CaiB-like acyl-CoA transferase
VATGVRGTTDGIGAPLGDVRVVDLSRVLAGPYCTMLLADLGADVVKVERPGEGDETRTWGPPYAGPEAAYFLAVNRSKRSLAVDLKAADGRALVLDLCAAADVVLENFRPGTAARLGLDAASVHARNPAVVYCSITGFGRRGARDRAGYDFVVQAESGLMAITGEPEGVPAKAGVAVVDVLTGTHAAVAVLAALRRREATGAGERIEVSLLDSAFSGLVNVAQNALVTGEEPGRFGNAHPSIAPYQPFRASDGWIAVAAANDGLFARLCGALGLDELPGDSRFATNAQRVRNRDELMPLLDEAFARRPAEEWVAALDQAGVPAGKIRGVLEALRAAEPATVSVSHPTAGDVELVAPPFTLESAPLGRVTAPPLLGEHTREVLAELGLDASRIADLEARGVVAQAP